MSSRRTRSLCVAAAALLTVSFQMPADDSRVAIESFGHETSDDARALDWVTAQLRQNARSLSNEEVERTAQVLVREAHARGFEPGLVLAIIEIESQFDAFAVSHVGAIGLMQLMPNTGAYLAERIGVDWQGPRTLSIPAPTFCSGSRTSRSCGTTSKSSPQRWPPTTTGPARFGVGFAGVPRCPRATLKRCLRRGSAACSRSAPPPDRRPPRLRQPAPLRLECQPRAQRMWRSGP
jgi:hypothetical protein